MPFPMVSLNFGCFSISFVHTVTYCSDVGYSVWGIIKDFSKEIIFLFADEVKCPCSMATAAVYPNLSLSGTLKSRYQSGIYSHEKRWVYLLFVCLLFIFIYYLITYWNQSNNIEVKRLIMPNSYPFNYITHLTGAWYT